MTAMLDRLTCFVERAAPRRRKADRTPVACRVLVESTRADTTDAAEAMLTDVSVYGCSLQSDAEWLRTGRFVTLSFDGAEALQAIVRWRRDGAAGLEFLRPLGPTHAAWQDLADSPWPG